MTQNNLYPASGILRGFVRHFITVAVSLIALKMLVLLAFGRGVWVASKLDLAVLTLIIAVVVSLVSWSVKRRHLS